MSTSYFILEKGIIERQDLSIYEKMCCVVLAKWATEEIDGFNMETLADEMSCTISKAKETIRQLKSKGFIQAIAQEEIVKKTQKIIKAEDVEGLEPISFASTSALLSKEVLMEEVRTIISEPLNDSETKIILNFANDDLEKIKTCYKKAKNMQVGDKIEALMMELQRKEKPPAKLPPMTEEKIIEAPIKSPLNTHKLNEQAVNANPKLVKYSEEKYFNEERIQTTKVELQINDSLDEKRERPWYLDEDEEDAGNGIVKSPPSTQINANMIHKMKAYKKYGK